MRDCLIGVGIIAAFAGFAAAGCMTKACTLVGCFDSFTIVAKRDDGSFPTGMHRIEILVDGVTQTCTFAFAESSPGIGTASPSCSGFAVTVGNAQSCIETNTGTGVSLHCDPIPGQIIETITFMGTPAQVHAWQYVGDAVILDAAAAPTYGNYFPNGPECGGACRQASASWTLQ